MKEIWKEIPGYEGVYYASNHGHIKTLSRKYPQGKIFKTKANPEGYHRINLYKNGMRRSFGVHRLVLMAFIANPLTKPRVNHIDNNPGNNHLENLEWATHQEDIDHKCRQNRQNRPFGEKSNFFGLKGSSHPAYGKQLKNGKSPRAREVLDTQTGIYYDCVKEAAHAKNINHNTLYNKLINNRKNNTGLQILDKIVHY